MLRKRCKFVPLFIYSNLVCLSIDPMFLQAVPPPIPPPPPPGLPLENEMILLVLGLIYGMYIMYKVELKSKTKIFVHEKSMILKELYNHIQIQKETIRRS